MKLSKNTIILIAVVAVLAIFGVTQYNGLVGQEENVNRSSADLQSAYQRRADLIPNLVNTVKGYAKHESETLEGVVAARAKATQMTIDPANATPEQLAAFQKTQGELSQALGRLLMLTENYPNLKADAHFSQLQAQLEGTENRINESRKLFNKSVQTYNVKMRTFPTNIIAGMAGFEKKSGFEASPEAQNAPSVQF